MQTIIKSLPRAHLLVYIVEGKLLLLSEGSKITRWYKENLLQVNVQKHQSMELGAESETNNINLHIGAVNIKQLKSIKLFGVFLDSELNFSEHITAPFAKRLANG